MADKKQEGKARRDNALDREKAESIQFLKLEPEIP